MTYTKVILCLVFLLTVAFTQAQDNLSPEKAKELIELHQSIKGTYQIQLDGIRKQQSLDLKMVEKIEAARLEAKITFISNGPNSRILILPKKTIKARGFKPIKPVSYTYSDEPAY